jgi:hypothetical protein
MVNEFEPIVASRLELQLSQGPAQVTILRHIDIDGTPFDWCQVDTGSAVVDVDNGIEGGRWGVAFMVSEETMPLAAAREVMADFSLAIEIADALNAMGDELVLE